MIIRDFFKDRRNGFFLDVGCADCFYLSNTAYLETDLGWSGIGVDALAEFGPGYVKDRPKTKFHNYLVTDKSTGKQKFYRAEALPEVSSTQKKVAAEQARQYRGDGTVAEIEVPSITLNELLDQNGVSKIDFLNLDIEEHEPAALAGFDINRFQPELVCVEAHPAVREELLKYFTAHGYKRLEKYLPYDNVNWYFTLN